MADVAVVSYNEKGFWQGDLYCDASTWDQHDWDGAIPDAYFTCKRDEGPGVAVAKAQSTWPDAELMIDDDASVYEEEE